MRRVWPRTNGYAYIIGFFNVLHELSSLIFKIVEELSKRDDDATADTVMEESAPIIHEAAGDTAIDEVTADTAMEESASITDEVVANAAAEEADTSMGIDESFESMADQQEVYHPDPVTKGTKEAKEDVCVSCEAYLHYSSFSLYFFYFRSIRHSWTLGVWWTSASRLATRRTRQTRASSIISSLPSIPPPLALE